VHRSVGLKESAIEAFQWPGSVRDYRATEPSTQSRLTSSVTHVFGIYDKVGKIRVGLSLWKDFTIQAECRKSLLTPI
jgi:hypothetical protein